MLNLCDISQIKNLLSKHQFKFSKSLGQNFIVDSEVCPKMAEFCSKNEHSGILEIGPGIGVLTVQLAQRFKKVVSVEIDKRLVPILGETVSRFENVKIINQDILKVDLSKIIQEEFSDCSEVNVCANLPYYITSEIIMHILENNPGFKSITVMVQKEAAERICALPGTRQSGAISLAVRYYGIPEILFNVNRNCFIPSPNVDSCVIRIEMKGSNHQDIKNKKNFFRVIRAAYSKRRKNLLNSLSMGLNISKEDVKEILKKCEIDCNLRAEQLKFEEFIDISNLFSDLKF